MAIESVKDPVCIHTPEELTLGAVKIQGHATSVLDYFTRKLSGKLRAKAYSGTGFSSGNENRLLHVCISHLFLEKLNFQGR